MDFIGHVRDRVMPQPGYVVLAQHEALDLPRRGLRQFRHHLHPPRVFVRRQPCPAVPHQIRLEPFRHVVDRLFGTIQASGLISPSASSRPMTAASSTSGCSISAASISAGEHQMPPTFSMSPLRPL